VKLLLDTHLLLLAAGDMLPKDAARYFLDEENILLFSPASIWEAVIKNTLNRPDFKADPFALYQGLLDNGYEELCITGNHTLLAGTLPPIHKDPFDRILIAQAKSEGAVLLTADATVARYPLQVICVKGRRSKNT
jgi:PIN domain nuclease of toxin-antitoxin system